MNRGRQQKPWYTGGARGTNAVRQQGAQSVKLTWAWRSRPGWGSGICPGQKTGCPRSGWRLAGGTPEITTRWASGMWNTVVWCSALPVRTEEKRNWLWTSVVWNEKLWSSECISLSSPLITNTETGLSHYQLRSSIYNIDINEAPTTNQDIIQIAICHSPTLD